MIPRLLLVLVCGALAGGAASAQDRSRAAVRLPVRASSGDPSTLSPLSYGGGFETKTWLYETLVRRGPGGAIVPGLAVAWEWAQGGRAVVLALRPGASFHDGSPVDAEAVCRHFERFLGQSEHAWLGATERITSVEAVAPDRVRIQIDRPYALLSDLCATNPCAVAAPSSFDEAGRFVRPVGSGPMRFVGAEGGRLRYERVGDGQSFELVRFGPDDPAGAPVEALRAGEFEAVVDGWLERIPRASVAGLARDERFQVVDAPGSSVIYASFRMTGPTASRDLRREIARAVDREEIAWGAELGYADPCDAWAAPSVRIWPRPGEGSSGAGNSEDGESGAPEAGSRAPLILLLEAGARTEPAGRVLAAQLRRSGLPVEVAARAGDAYRFDVDRGRFDLRLEETWGVPYDPLITLLARFLPPPQDPTASTIQFTGVDREWSEEVRRAAREPDPSRRRELYVRIQDRLTREAWIVPLCAPRRIAVVRRDAGEVRIDHDLYRVGVEGLRAGDR